MPDLFRIQLHCWPDKLFNIEKDQLLKKNTQNNVVTCVPVPWVGLQCVIVVFPDHTHLLFVFLKSVSLFHK